MPPAEWQQSPRVQVITTNQAGRAFGSNLGAALARGTYIHFLHDDDYLMPGAIKALLEVADSGDYVWVYGGLSRLDNDGNHISDDIPDVQGNIITVLLAGDCVHLCVSIIRRDDFMAVGGFDPLIRIVDDKALEWKLALRGKFGRTSKIVAGVRVGAVGSTNDWSKVRQELRWVREQAMNTRGIGRHIARSMPEDHFAHGRLARAYIFSGGLNLLEGHPIIAIARFWSAFRILMRRPMSIEFYRGVMFNIHHTDPQTRRSYREVVRL